MNPTLLPQSERKAERPGKERGEGWEGQAWGSLGPPPRARGGRAPGDERPRGDPQGGGRGSRGLRSRNETWRSL